VIDGEALGLPCSAIDYGRPAALAA
jgi:hypothetical protein